MDLEEIVRKLSGDLQKEEMEFASLLLDERTKKKGAKLNNDWAGVLRD